MYSTVQHSAVQYSTVQHSTVQYLDHGHHAEVILPAALDTLLQHHLGAGNLHPASQHKEGWE